MPNAEHPDVPLALWALHLVKGKSLRRALAERVLDAFVPFGGVVVDAAPGHGELRAAGAAAGRRVVPLPGSLLAARPPSGPSNAPVDAVVALPPAARLTVPRRWPVGAMGAAALAQRSVSVLRPGGVLVVASVSGAEHDGDDPLAEAARGAASSGLAFFQHVVALLAPPDGVAEPRRVAHADVLVFRGPV